MSYFPFLFLVLVLYIFDNSVSFFSRTTDFGSPDKKEDFEWLIK